MVGIIALVLVTNSEMLNGRDQYVAMLVLLSPGCAFNAEVISQVVLEFLQRLNSEGVTINQKERPPEQANRPQLGNDASGGNRLTGSGRHLEIHPSTMRLSSGEHLRNCNPLIISQRSMQLDRLRSEGFSKFDGRRKLCNAL